eukprot:TRINITY_DN3607_c0_g3_i1.p1 TRINITY_DN3607_c0_g3~~TRINITY_DN3607_c0_g3_i1.p1  ORF type:complete len:1163 (+),score=427.92 TRINITY_DN3607_c0_g3_i1:505-3489(+)
MPTPKHTKWDSAEQTPAAGGGVTPGGAMGATPTGMTGATPMGFTGATPMGFMGATPLAAAGADATQQMRRVVEMHGRNKPYSDEELDDLLPSEGYAVVPQPASYKPITPARKYDPTKADETPAFMEEESPMQAPRIDVVDLGPDLPSLRDQHDYQLFGALVQPRPDHEMSKDERKDILVLQLLLKIKNGNPQQRKSATKSLTEKAQWLGAERLCGKILPILMVEDLEDQQRHVVVKLLGRIMYKLDHLIRPFAFKILVVTSPMLIDNDYVTRAEGREIISNLAKAAGLVTMIKAMSDDCDNTDEYVRNVTARAIAVVTSALGIPSMLPFLRAICKSKNSWLARHTGIKIVQQIAILMGCGVQPHLKDLVESIQGGLVDAQQKVRTMAGLAIASLAEAAAPYGEEAFYPVLRPLWEGAHNLRGKPLAAFLKAIGYIIPLMSREASKRYTDEIVPKLTEEMRSPDSEMKRIVLKVIKQCVATDGVSRDFIKAKIIPEFFKNFWVKRTAADHSSATALVEATVEIANKVGAMEIISKIVDDLKDEHEAYRKMVMETIQRVMESLGAVDIDSNLEQKLMDGLLYAFTSSGDEIGETLDGYGDAMLNGFAAVVTALGPRIQPYLPQIAGTVRHRLSLPPPAVRMQAADLVARICRVMKTCEEDDLLGRLGEVFYESLSEEKPEVLGSILSAIKGIVSVVGMHKMRPPVSDLLPRLTPILTNRHEKVQEHCVDLVGRIADRGYEGVSVRYWSRVAQELLRLLTAHKKAIRRAAVNTFGYIAAAIGPMDVMNLLLNNLQVQDRTERVCTTVAIAIVAETCRPFTVVPLLINEYRAPETNIQRGVLKALSFMFEYIRELAKDYCYAVLPLLEDALMDRDIIHRQMGCNIVRHMALGVAGMGCEPAVIHLLNLVFPNIFETLPRTIDSCVEAIEACRVCLGPVVIHQYLLSGLFHPARKVREMYWKLYNHNYIAAQDALVPAFPRIPDDASNKYCCTELDVFI